MGKRYFVVFSCFILGFFYTNCSPNQFSIKEQALLVEQQQQQPPPPPNNEGAAESPPTLDSENHEAVSTQTQWQQVPLRTQAQKKAGLAGGEGMQIVFDIASAPSNSKVYYLVSDTSQVWKSIDGGYNWTKKSKGFVINGGKSVVVDPANENKVLVAGSMHSVQYPPNTSPYEGIYRTTDGGNTWTLEHVTHYRRPSSNMRGGVHFAFDPNNSNIIYAGTDDQGVLKSTNGGDTWKSLNLLTSFEILDIKAHPTNSNIIYVTADSSGLWKITNPGGSVFSITSNLSSNGCYSSL